MHPILSAGILIGVLCAIWTFVMGFTGWYKDPAMANAFFLVIPIEIAGLVWGLKRTSAEERTYRAQLVAGTLMSVVAGVIIVCSSLLFTTVAFPEYFRELEAAQRKIMQSQGKSAAEIEQVVRDNASSTTPMGQAMAGFVGTLVTGIVASAVIAIWVRDTRRKNAPPH
ncbi:MAG: DUF4199 domain-containing protein [Vicinamibacterales bacterium]